MGKKEDQAFLAILNQIQSRINKLDDPNNNPAQKFLTDEALGAAQWLKGGDYSQLPKGMFFDFKMPGEEIDRYKKMANVSQGGTFALSDPEGRGAATGIQNKYLTDKFARDASQNYQDNVSNAYSTVRSGLAGAAGAKTGQDAQIMQHLQGLGSMSMQWANRPKQQKWWEKLLPLAGSAISALV